MKETILSLLVVSALLLCFSADDGIPVTRAYFENLDKESRLEDIVEDIGNYGVEGSGILFCVWKLNDRTRAKIVFDSKGRIVMIYITGENSGERIYKREYPRTGYGSDRSETTDGISLEDAVREMRKAIGEQLPASGRLSFPDPMTQDFELFDVTGDGCADLCTCVTWGSGMVRTDLVVYDPRGKTLFVLDGYNYDYLIDHVEEDRIVIVMEGPKGYNDPMARTFGTAELENGRLVFVPDAKAP